VARIAVVGSYGVGMTMTVPRIPAPGETLRANGFDLGAGGKGSNQAICARRLGAEVELLTCIGPDDFGAAARALWEREGVGISYLKVGTRPTMVGFILVEPNGENRITIAPGALDELGPEEVERFQPAIEAADLCLVSLEIPLSTATAALETARRVGTPTLLNPAPGHPLPTSTLALADYLTPNRGEAQALLGWERAETPEALLAGLRQRCPGGIVLTLGGEGALLAAADGDVCRVPAAAPRQVVDTTGAGDAFNAALAVALAEGYGLASAVACACVAGARAVERLGVIDALPYRHQVPGLAGPDGD
jgi:ribokinase